MHYIENFDESLGAKLDPWGPLTFQGWVRPKTRGYSNNVNAISIMSDV